MSERLSFQILIFCERDVSIGIVTANHLPGHQAVWMDQRPDRVTVSRFSKKYEKKSNGGFKMQAIKKYSERRFSKRKSNPRRHKERLNISFEMLLSDQRGKTINVSRRGAYCEVVTENMEVFSLGATIPLQIITATNTHDPLKKKLNFNGRGKVVWKCIIKNPGRANNLGVALEFTEELLS